jgi:hypothetical protein
VSYNARPNWCEVLPKLTGPPLTVVESFSPQQGAQAVMGKVDVYPANGVKSCWVVSPPLNTVTILTADGRRERLVSGIAKDPATGLFADLAALFA